MQNAHKFLKIKFGTSKGISWLAVADSGFSLRLLGESASSALLLFVLLLWKSLRSLKPELCAIPANRDHKNGGEDGGGVGFVMNSSGHRLCLVSL